MGTVSSLNLSKSRIEALSDGVFSIAMTLLVLKLEAPALMHHAENTAMQNMEMLEQLLAMAPGFMTYVATFMIAGGFWFLQHLTFHFIRHADSFLVWVNLIFLMLVSLLPFSAGLMNHLLVHPVSQFFYYGNHMAIALLLNVHWQYAKRRGLTGGGAETVEERRLTLRVSTTVVMFAGCLIVAAILPMWSWVPIPAGMMAVAIAERRLQVHR